MDPIEYNSLAGPLSCIAFGKKCAQKLRSLLLREDSNGRFSCFYLAEPVLIPERVEQEAFHNSI